jgi:hypothetical protein
VVGSLTAALLALVSLALESSVSLEATESVDAGGELSLDSIVDEVGVVEEVLVDEDDDVVLVVELLDVDVVLELLDVVLDEEAGDVVVGSLVVTGVVGVSLDDGAGPDGRCESPSPPQPAYRSPRLVANAVVRRELVDRSQGAVL